jgi:hypothetical protein
MAMSWTLLKYRTKQFLDSDKHRRGLISVELQLYIPGSYWQQHIV